MPLDYEHDDTDQGSVKERVAFSEKEEQSNELSPIYKSKKSQKKRLSKKSKTIINYHQESMMISNRSVSSLKSNDKSQWLNETGKSKPTLQKTDIKNIDSITDEMNKTKSHKSLPELPLLSMKKSSISQSNYINQPLDVYNDELEERALS